MMAGNKSEPPVGSEERDGSEQHRGPPRHQASELSETNTVAPFIRKGLLKDVPSDRVAKNVNADGFLLPDELAVPDLSGNLLSRHAKALIHFFNGNLLASGDATASSPKSAAFEEHSTVALVAALILTCQLALLLTWWQVGVIGDDQEYLVNLWGESFAWWFHVTTVPIQLFTILMNLISVLQAVAMMLLLNECSGDMEVEAVMAKMGRSREHGAFLAMCGGTAPWFLYLIFWCTIFAGTRTAAISCVVLGLLWLVVTHHMFPGVIPVFLALADVKRTARSNSPVDLGRGQVQAALKDFSEVVSSKRLISPSNFESYLKGRFCSSDMPAALSYMTSKCCAEEVDAMYEELYEGPEVEAGLQKAKMAVEKHASLLEAAHLDLESLVAASDQGQLLHTVLKDAGVPSPGERLKLVLAIQELAAAKINDDCGVSNHQHHQATTPGRAGRRKSRQGSEDGHAAMEHDRHLHTQQIALQMVRF